MIVASARRIGLADAEYPEILRGIPDPPQELHVEGALAARNAVAIVGSRHPSPYGLRMARRIARQAAESGWVVVSGLARGIDTAAHETVVEAGATTWAVLGSALDRIYPAENEPLARRIVEAGGCLLSEYPPGTGPLRGRFPQRNRIVAGLCLGTIVVEGRERSGSLITARLAVEQGREVFAVPGPADSPLSAAPHRLIRQGACLVRDFADVAEALALPASFNRKNEIPGLHLPSEHGKILELLSANALSLDDLVAATGLDTPRLSNIIFELETRDLVVAVAGQRYAKKAS